MLRPYAPSSRLNARARARVLIGSSPKRARGPSDVAGANLEMDGMTVDGLVLKDIRCRTSDGGVGGLFGGITLGASFKSRTLTGAPATMAGVCAATVFHGRK